MCCKDQNLIQLDRESAIFKKWHQHSLSNLFPKCRDAFRHQAWLTLSETERDDNVSAYTKNDYYSPGGKKKSYFEVLWVILFSVKEKSNCSWFACYQSMMIHPLLLYQFMSKTHVAVQTCHFSSICYFLCPVFWGGGNAPTQRKAGKNSNLCSNAK